MNAGIWTIVGMLTGAAGLVIQQVSGIVLPIVPAALVFLVLAAGLVVGTRWR